MQDLPPAKYRPLQRLLGNYIGAKLELPGQGRLHDLGRYVAQYTWTDSHGLRIALQLGVFWAVQLSLLAIPQVYRKVSMVEANMTPALGAVMGSAIFLEAMGVGWLLAVLFMTLATVGACFIAYPVLYLTWACNGLQWNPSPSKAAWMVFWLMAFYVPVVAVRAKLRSLDRFLFFMQLYAIIASLGQYYPRSPAPGVAPDNHPQAAGPAWMLVVLGFGVGPALAIAHLVMPVTSGRWLTGYLAHTLAKLGDASERLYDELAVGGEERGHRRPPAATEGGEERGHRLWQSFDGMHSSDAAGGSAGEEQGIQLSGLGDAADEDPERQSLRGGGGGYGSLCGSGVGKYGCSGGSSGGGGSGSGGGGEGGRGDGRKSYVFASSRAGEVLGDVFSDLNCNGMLPLMGATVPLGFNVYDPGHNRFAPGSLQSLLGLARSVVIALGQPTAFLSRNHAAQGGSAEGGARASLQGGPSRAGSSVDGGGSGGGLGGGGKGADAPASEDDGGGLGGAGGGGLGGALRVDAAASKELQRCGAALNWALKALGQAMANRLPFESALQALQELEETGRAAARRLVVGGAEPGRRVGGVEPGQAGTAAAEAGSVAAGGGEGGGAEEAGRGGLGGGDTCGAGGDSACLRLIVVVDTFLLVTYMVRRMYECACPVVGLYDPQAVPLMERYADLHRLYNGDPGFSADDGGDIADARGGPPMMEDDITTASGPNTPGADDEGGSGGGDDGICGCGGCGGVRTAPLPQQAVYQAIPPSADDGVDKDGEGDDQGGGVGLPSAGGPPLAARLAKAAGTSGASRGGGRLRACLPRHGRKRGARSLLDGANNDDNDDLADVGEGGNGQPGPAIADGEGRAGGSFVLAGGEGRAQEKAGAKSGGKGGKGARPRKALPGNARYDDQYWGPQEGGGRCRMALEWVYRRTGFTDPMLAAILQLSVIFLITLMLFVYPPLVAFSMGQAIVMCTYGMAAMPREVGRTGMLALQVGLATIPGVAIGGVGTLLCYVATGGTYEMGAPKLITMVAYMFIVALVLDTLMSRLHTKWKFAFLSTKINAIVIAMTSWPEPYPVGALPFRSIAQRVLWFSISQLLAVVGQMLIFPVSSRRGLRDSLREATELLDAMWERVVEAAQVHDVSDDFTDAASNNFSDAASNNYCSAAIHVTSSSSSTSPDSSASVDPPSTTSPPSGQTAKGMPQQPPPQHQLGQGAEVFKSLSPYLNLLTSLLTEQMPGQALRASWKIERALTFEFRTPYDFGAALRLIECLSSMSRQACHWALLMDGLRLTGLGSALLTTPQPSDGADADGLRLSGLDIAQSTTLRPDDDVGCGGCGGSRVGNGASGAGGGGVGGGGGGDGGGGGEGGGGIAALRGAGVAVRRCLQGLRYYSQGLISTDRMAQACLELEGAMRVLSAHVPLASPGETVLVRRRKYCLAMLLAAMWSASNLVRHLAQLCATLFLEPKLREEALWQLREQVPPASQQNDLGSRVTVLLLVAHSPDVKGSGLAPPSEAGPDGGQQTVPGDGRMLMSQLQKGLAGVAAVVPRAPAPQLGEQVHNTHRTASSVGWRMSRRLSTGQGGGGSSGCCDVEAATAGGVGGGGGKQRHSVYAVWDDDTEDEVAAQYQY